MLKKVLLAMCLAAPVYADTGFPTTIRVTEQDNVPACTVGQLKVTNGTLTCSGQVANITTGGGGGGAATLPLPGGATNYIQNTSTLQSGATFYVSSGTVSGPLTVKTLSAYNYSSLDYFSMTPRSSSFAPSANLDYTFASSGKNLNFNIFTLGSGVGRLGLYDESSNPGCGPGGFLFTTPIAGGSATNSICISAGYLTGSDFSATYGVTVSTAIVYSTTVSTQVFIVKDTYGNSVFRIDNTPAVSTDTLFGVTASTSTTWAFGISTDTITGPWALHISSAGWVNLRGSDVPPNSQALCLLGGALGHCTSVVGMGGGCTCVSP